MKQIRQIRKEKKEYLTRVLSEVSVEVASQLKNGVGYKESKRIQQKMQTECRQPRQKSETIISFLED